MTEQEIVARVVYASEACVGEGVYAEMERIRSSAMRHNVPAGIHTALLHQSGWFVQWKEGPAVKLQALMARVDSDPRHHSLRLVHASRGRRLLSGPWSMAIVQCNEPREAMSQRVLRVRSRLQEGRPLAPPVVWRQLSTPMEHPGAARQADADAFQRVMICAAAGQQSFDIVKWLARDRGESVVHRRFAGGEGLDVGTDYVDFDDGQRVMRVIAMARKGLQVPLTRAFLSDYSHLVVVLSGEPQRDRALMLLVTQACAGLAVRPVLVGIAAQASTHAEPFAAARRAGLVYLETLAVTLQPDAIWAALRPLLARWRETARRTPATDSNALAMR